MGRLVDQGQGLWIPRKTIQKTLAITALLLNLAGCSTNPMTGETEINRTAVGAVICTVADGLVGAAIGCGTGYVLDRKHEELQDKLKGTGLTVQKQVDGSKAPGNSRTTCA